MQAANSADLYIADELFQHVNPDCAGCSKLQFAVIACCVACIVRLGLNCITDNAQIIHWLQNATGARLACCLHYILFQF
jgi:hypothetical protein